MRQNTGMVMRWIIFVIIAVITGAGSLAYAQITGQKIIEPMALIVNPVLSVTHGPISGEVTENSVVLWARGNNPGMLIFEVADNENFAKPGLSIQVKIDAKRDFTGKARVEELKPRQLYYYRVVLAANGERSQPVSGQFRTAPVANVPTAFSFTFSAGLGGQGYCRKPEIGWTIFKTILAEQPDFFILHGDSVDVDSACPSPDNVPGAEGPYSDLEGFRTRYRYHLSDQYYAAFLAKIPIFSTWDDHEILDNFSGVSLRAINPKLFAEGLQAYLEYWPMLGTEDDPQRIYRRFSYGAYAEFFMLDTRSYRDPIVNWDPNPRTLNPKTMLGAEQFAWLQQGLAKSKALWKFIVTSVPLSYATGWPQPEVDGRDGWANYTEHSGYETELMAVLFLIATHDIENVIFLAGDTHWPFAISYDPDRDGTPNFYEFGASPMSSIPLAPAKFTDPTFNPTVLYAEGQYQGDLFNFGKITIAESGELTFTVINWQGKEHYALTLQPE